MSPPYTLIVERPGLPPYTVLGWSWDVCHGMGLQFIRSGATRAHCAALSIDLKAKP